VGCGELWLVVASILPEFHAGLSTHGSRC
jgi:hypothetical protein